METVENYKVYGENKKELVLEVMCLVIDHDLPISEEVQQKVIKNIRKYGPQVIDVVASVSVNARKLCCC